MTTPTSSFSVQIRPATPEDLPAIAAIYAHAVLHGTGTFEITPPSLADMTARHAEVTGRGLPWLVAHTATTRDAEPGQTVIGYAYANWFRPRPAYRFFVEDSLYVAPEVHGQGVGRLLLSELIAQCTLRGARQMVAVIGDSDNHGSIGVHKACGFEPTGVLRSSGWKFDRWLDVVLMQRALGQGDETAPAEKAEV